MITAYNIRTRQLTSVEKTYMLKPASEWRTNPVIEDRDKLFAMPSSDWYYDEETNVLRPMTAEELDVEEGRVEFAKNAQMGLMRVKCEQEITNGYYSSTLGLPYWYDGDLTDQLNLIGAIQASTPSSGYPNGLNMFHPCRDSATSIKSYESHTNEQLKMILNDGVDFRSKMLQKFNMKCIAIRECTRVSSVLLIVWEDA